MAVEVATHISDLNPLFPSGGDPVSQGDDHLRLLKKVLQDTFKGAVGAIITGPDGSFQIVAGTTAQRDSAPELGMFRYNSDDGQFEGFTSNGWGQVGGGQMYGKAPVKAVFYNSQSIAENLTVAAGQNGLSAGPVQVENGFTVTVSNGSTWSVV